jgi:hypothetical protein
VAKIKKVSITKRRGAFVVDYRDQAGSRKRNSFQLREQAEAYRSKVLASMQTQVLIETAVVSEKEIPESVRQYRAIVESERRGQTALNERYYFEEFILWLWNDEKLTLVSEINPFHFEKFRALLRAKGNKASTINRKFNSYRAWLNKCVFWGSIAKNPMDKLGRLDEEPSEMKDWTRGQLNEAREKVPSWLKDVLLFLDGTGRRPIDAARAKFADVDELKLERLELSHTRGENERTSFSTRLMTCLK